MSRAEHAELDAVLTALYDNVSGPAGRVCDLERERELFHPRARLMRSGIDADGRPWLRVMSVEEYVEDTAEYFAEHPFYEAQIGREVERFGNVAQVRSCYEARHDPADPEPFKRGVNFIQLFHDGSRWWVTSVIWDNERPGLEVPPHWYGGGGAA